MLYAIVIVLYVCLSVRLSVCHFLTITQERLYVEWWNFAQLYLRSRVTSGSKMGHVQNLRPRQIEDIHKVIQSAYKATLWTFYIVPIPVEYLHICATAVYYHLLLSCCSWSIYIHRSSAASQFKPVIFDFWLHDTVHIFFNLRLSGITRTDSFCNPVFSNPWFSYPYPDHKQKVCIVFQVNNMHIHFNLLYGDKENNNQVPVLSIPLLILAW